MTLFLLTFLSWSVFSQEEGPVVMITDDTTMKKNGCWATLYDEHLFRGSNMTIFNGYDVSDLEFSAGPVWREDIKSIVAGATARLSLFSRENFQGSEYTVHPSTHLEKVPWDEVKSLKLTCVSLEERRGFDENN